MFILATRHAQAQPALQRWHSWLKMVSGTTNLCRLYEGHFPTPVDLLSRLLWSCCCAVDNCADANKGRRNGGGIIKINLNSNAQPLQCCQTSLVHVAAYGRWHRRCQWCRSTWTVVAPQSLRKSAGVWRGLTVQRTSYPASSAFLTTCLPRVPVLPTTSMLSFGTGVPSAAAWALNWHLRPCLRPESGRVSDKTPDAG